MKRIREAITAYYSFSNGKQKSLYFNFFFFL
jgi:hypothetical protein